MAKVTTKQSALPFTEERKTSIQQRLLQWYRIHQRDLPWRRDQDPYKIWVSEVMLQQTRVETVIPYFHRFLERFPTLEALAAADEADVIKAWEGLGYYSRVRNLHAAVKEVVEKHGGKVPDTLETISQLKGVGPYTAGAILSIAYNRRVPAVDGNVLRVFSRLFASTDDIARVQTRKKMETWAYHLIPESNPRDFNQALMELGAMVCTPTSPSCATCPVRSDCLAYEKGMQHDLPVKKKAKPPVPVSLVFGWIRDGDRVLLERRPETGLLAGLWGLPTLETDASDSVQALIAWMEKHGMSIQPGETLGMVEHVFTHRKWRATIIGGTCVGIKRELPQHWRWATLDELEKVALPKVYQKAVQTALSSIFA
jgi:A/G-specific adenine glycosylase